MKVTAAILAAVTFATPCYTHEIVLEWNKDLRPPGRAGRPNYNSMAKMNNGHVLLSGTRDVVDENGEEIPYVSQVWIAQLDEDMDRIDWQRSYGDQRWFYETTDIIQNQEHTVVMGTSQDGPDYDSRRVNLLYLNSGADSVDFIECATRRQWNPFPTLASFSEDSSIDLFVSFTDENAPLGAVYRISSERQIVSERYIEDDELAGGRFLSPLSVSRMRNRNIILTGMLEIERHYDQRVHRGMAAATVMLNEDGDLVWSRTHLDSALYRQPDMYVFNSDGHMNCALEHSSGVIYTSGTTDIINGGQIDWGVGLYKYSPDGELIWTKYYNDNFIGENISTYFRYIMELRPDLLAVLGHLTYRANDGRQNGLYVAIIDSSGELLTDTFIRGDWIRDDDRFEQVLRIDSTRVLAMTSNYPRIVSIRFDLDPTEVAEEPEVFTPSTLSLSCVPNPFNSTLTIRYGGGLETAPTRLTINDIAGREVANFISSATPLRVAEHKTADHGGSAEENSVVWDATAVPAGVYVVRLEAGTEIVTRKVVLVR